MSLISIIKKSVRHVSKIRDRRRKRMQHVSRYYLHDRASFNGGRNGWKGW